MNRIHLLLATALLMACANTEEEPRTMCPTQLVLAADFNMPDGGTLAVDEAWLSVGDFVFYGNTIADDDPLNRMARLIIPEARAHAGHAHGEAAVECSLPGVWTVPLSTEGVVLGEMEVPEGHYSDGRLRLSPATEETNVNLLEDQAQEAPGVTLHLRGAATTAQGNFILEVDVAVDSTVAGLELTSYVRSHQDNTLELRVKLGHIVGALDLPGLADDQARVVLSAQDDSAALLKIALKDRLNYTD